MQADTIVPNPGNPQSLNRFSYVLNNPLRYTDPTGHVYIGGVTPEDPIPDGCLTPCEIVYSPEGLRNTWNAVKATASLTVDFVPVVGDVKGVVEAFTGYDLFTGEELGNWRWMGLLGASEVRHLGLADDVIQLKLPGFENILKQQIPGKLSEAAKKALRSEARDIFDRVNPGLRDRLKHLEIQVHHRIPLEWAHLFPNSDPNRVSNLIGLPKDIHELISNRWTEFRTLYERLGRSPTEWEVMEFAARLDKEFSQYYH